MIGLERSNSEGIARLRSTARGYTFRELAHLAYVSERQIRRVLRGRQSLNLRAVRDLARVLKVSTTYLMRGGDRHTEDPSIAWLLAVLAVPRQVVVPLEIDVPAAPQVITVVTSRIVVLRWAPWSARPVSAAEIRRVDHLKPGPGIVAAKLTATGMVCRFEDRMNVSITFEDMVALWGDDMEPPFRSRLDAPGAVVTVRVMKKGAKQRRVGPNTRVVKPKKGAPAVEVPNPEEGGVRVPRAAELLDVHPQTIRSYVHNKTIIAKKLGPRLWIIPMSEINRLLGKDGPPKV